MLKSEMKTKGWKTANWQRYLRQLHNNCWRNDSILTYEVKNKHHQIRCSKCITFNDGKEFVDKKGGKK